MGVHGLTTFLRENRLALSKTIHFSPQDEHYTPVVIDGWSLIYKVVEDSGLPWVYGGEYGELYDIVVKIVKTWLTVKIRPIFVFDGSTPPEKFNTVIHRLNQSRVQQALLFFRTSPAARSARRFLNEIRIIPPMVLVVCVQALLAFQRDADGTSVELEEEPGLIDIHFADEEADPYAVDLAGRVGGYVAGRDSDFVVLNSGGYLGYIPLEEMIWLASEDGASQHPVQEAEDGFQSVQGKKKSTRKRMSSFGIIPPDTEISSLSASLYTPSSLAKHLKLPVSLLPLLGALVGNDYTLQAADRPSFASSMKTSQGLMFARNLTVSQRIMHAGKTLSDLLYSPPGKRRHKTPGSVMELIQLTVSSLLSTGGAPSALSGADRQAAIVESMVEGTLPYAMPPRPLDDAFLCETVCALHHPQECRLVAQMDRSEMNYIPNFFETVSSLYLRAYRLGKLSPSLMDILSTRTFKPELFLENPDLESVACSISREVRQFGYALFEHGVVIPAPPPELEDEALDEGPGSNEDPDELIDVTEDPDDEYDYEDEVSEEVDKLRGALRDLQFEDGISTDDNSLAAESSSAMSSVDPTASFHSPEPLQRRPYARKTISARRKMVTEYIRRGTRIIAEDVEVPPLQHFLPSLSSDGDILSTTPIQLRPEEERIGVLLRFLEVDPQSFSTISSEDRIPVLALRLVVRKLHDRAEEAGNTKERMREKWTRKEARAFIASTSTSVLSDPSDLPFELSERSIQLTAQISTALECIGHLTQILLLTDAVPGCAHRFSGLRFHSLLASSSDVDVDQAIWSAVTNGMESCFGEVWQSKKAKRKARKAAANTNNTSPTSARNKIVGSGSIYSLLSDMSA